MPEAKDYLYTDDPWLFVNNNNQGSLQILLECIKGNSKIKLLNGSQLAKTAMKFIGMKQLV